MSDKTLYVPILKSKLGEFGALRELRDTIRRLITPVFELAPPDLEHTPDGDDDNDSLTEKLSDAWPDRPFYLRGHGIARILQRCEQVGLEAIPVIEVRSPDRHLKSVLQATTRNEICVQLTTADFEDDTPVQARVDHVLHVTGMKPDDVHILLDVGDLKGDFTPSVIVARAMLGELPFRDQWRRVIVAAASFPENLSEFERQSERLIPRSEWSLWQKLRTRGVLPRNAIFGDYGISNPAPPPNLDPRTMRMSASIRYTTDTEWLVLKGKNVREAGFDQYFDLAKRLVARPEYRGLNFSWGDNFIYKCSQRGAGPGNATTWRKAGTNHHITLVTRALSSLDGTSA